MSNQTERYIHNGTIIFWLFVLIVLIGSMALFDIDPIKLLFSFADIANQFVSAFQSIH